MQFHFDDSTPLYQQIAAQLEEMIFTGGFDEGSQIVLVQLGVDKPVVELFRAFGKAHCRQQQKREGGQQGQHGSYRT